MGLRECPHGKGWPKKGLAKKTQSGENAKQLPPEGEQEGRQDETAVLWIEEPVTLARTVPGQLGCRELRSGGGEGRDGPFHTWAERGSRGRSSWRGLGSRGALVLLGCDGEEPSLCSWW